MAKTAWWQRLFFGYPADTSSRHRYVRPEYVVPPCAACGKSISDPIHYKLTTTYQYEDEEKPRSYT